MGTMIIAVILWLAVGEFSPPVPDWATDWFPPDNFLIPLLVLVLTPVLVLMVYLLLGKLWQAARSDQHLSHAHLRYWLRIQSLALLLTWLALLWLANWGDRAEALLPVNWIAAAAAITILPLLLASGLCALLRCWYTFLRSPFRSTDRPAALLRASFIDEIRPNLLLMIPMIAIHGVSDWLRVNPDHDLWLQAKLPVPVEMLLMGIFILVLPSLVTWTLNARPMPPGAMRDRLLQLARKSGVALRQPYIWRTGSQPMATAMVVGLFSFQRRFYITDYFLQVMTADEVDAAFAHEFAHARHYHIGLLLGTAISFLLLLVFAVESSNILAPAAVGTLVAITFYIFFGRVSRHMEHHADIVSDELTENPGAIGQTLSSLIRITSINPDRRGWRHPAPQRRIEVVKRYQEDPEFKQRFQHHHTRLVCLVGLLCVLVSAMLLFQQVPTSPSTVGKIHFSRAHSHIIAARIHRDGSPSNLQRQDELLKGAENWFQQGIEEVLAADSRHPSLANAYRSLAAIYQSQGRFEEAASYRALYESTRVW